MILFCLSIRLMQRLINIVEQLRGPQGCPWDKQQTHQSLLPYLLEETYEVIEEIEDGQTGAPLLGELGDLLLQIVLHAQISAESGGFDIQDVINKVSDKMVRRHPHVFGEAQKGQSQEELTAQWDAIKASEKKTAKLFDDIPKSKPALVRAAKIGERAAKLGFDWPNPQGALDKVEEELAEVKAEIESGNKAALEGEIGDLLASIASLARHFKISPELALQKSNRKFIKRFQEVEKGIEAAAANQETLDLEQMETLWQKAKEGEQ